MVGQWSGPTLQNSSCKALLNALSVPLMPGSSSAVASMIFTVLVFSAGRLDLASCVAGSTCGPRPKPAPPPPLPPRAGGSSARLGPAIAPAFENAAPAGSPQVEPAPARTSPPPRPPAGAAGTTGRMLNWPDIKTAPLTPTPFGPQSSGRPM